MSENDWLAERFEKERAHLREVALRVLGSGPEADDAVQETWLRLSRAGAADVANLRGWLTTVVARICLDMLRTRRPTVAEAPDVAGDSSADGELLLADSIGPALLLVLDALAPAERLAFVLHDLFAVPFEEIAPIVGKSVDAARQLASRARRRVQGAAVPAGDREKQREIVDAFLAASRAGEFDRLLALLDPEVVLRADRTAVDMAKPAGFPIAETIRGATAVARTFSGRAQAAKPALIDGLAGAAWAPGGQLRSVLAFKVSNGKIVEIGITADPESLGHLGVTLR